MSQSSHKHVRDFEAMLRSDPDFKDDEKGIQDILNYGKKRVVRGESVSVYYFTINFWDIHGKVLKEHKGTIFEAECKKQLGVE